MVTRKEDAESIVGEEQAEELEQEAKLVGKSEAVVERTDDDEEEAEVEVETEEEETVESETTETPEEEAVEEEVELETEETEVQTLSKKIEQIFELLNPTVEPHVLDTVFETLRSQYDEVVEMDLTPDEKLQLLQDPFGEIGNMLRSGVFVAPEQEAQEAPSDVLTRAEFEGAISPLIEQVSLLVAQMEGGASANVVSTATSQQRSISQQELRLKAPKQEKPGSIASIALKSVGITSY